MNRPIAAVVIFFLLMCVKRLLLSLTPFLQYDTHTHTRTHTHTHTHARTHTRTCARFFSTSLSLPFCDLPFSRGSFSFSFYFLFFRHDGLIFDYSCFIHVWSHTNIAHKFYLIFPGTISCFPWHYNESHF